MITLYTFGPAFGCPDPSPFVTKALTLLKMSGLEFKTDTRGFNKAPKGKLPYIKDNGEIIADSTFIRLHLEDKHDIQFDANLSAEQRATGWAFEKLCEDHLYWTVVHDRWAVDANFNAGPKHFFDHAPAVMRPFIISMVRRKIARNLKGQGMGLLTDAERSLLTTCGINAIADYLGGKDYFMGPEPSATDATIFAFVNAGLCDRFSGTVLDVASARPNLIAYNKRMIARYFPDLGTAKGKSG